MKSAISNAPILDHRRMQPGRFWNIWKDFERDKKIQSHSIVVVDSFCVMKSDSESGSESDWLEQTDWIREWTKKCVAPETFSLKDSVNYGDVELLQFGFRWSQTKSQASAQAH